VPPGDLPDAMKPDIHCVRTIATGSSSSPVV
jgi:hypothetical protein